MSGKKKMVSVTFTGKELLEGKVFDTTEEKTAKEAGIFEEKAKYRPLTIITGEHEMLDKVEEEIEKMLEGEEKAIKLLAKDAFGERRSDLVRVVPLQNFHEQKISPFPGLLVRIGNAMGKVQSVGSGRVRVDFNHPLSGRDVEYSVKIVKEFKDKKEISEQIFEKYYARIPGTKKEIAEDTLTVTLEGEAFKNLVKINEAITNIAKELGIKLTIKETKALVEGKKVIVEKETAGEEKAAGGHEGGHYHSDGTYHAHPHTHEHEEKEEREAHMEEKPKQKGKIIDGDAVSAQKERPASIHKLADEFSKQKPKNQFDTFKDSASTIQRPKKK